MSNLIPKTVCQTILAFFVLAFTLVACKSKKAGDKKEQSSDSATVTQPAPTVPVEDTVKIKAVENPVDPVKDPPQ